MHLEFRHTEKLLSYPGGRVGAITSPYNPTPLGLHPIQIPDFPHPKGRHYRSMSPYAETRFFLGHGYASAGNDRYLHTGQVSAGCITVDPSAWTELYEYLISCRSNDAKTIGTLRVLR
ncbi:hypothetical protein LCI23_05735 [Massilia sp. MS-15]|nr:hypothetical protein [Massilia sp. MS-15]